MPGRPGAPGRSQRLLVPRAGLTPANCAPPLPLSPATRRALPPRRRRGPPKRSRQQPTRRRSDLARGPGPALLGWGLSRPPSSDRRRNNCARASCCVCRSSRPGGASMYAACPPPPAGPPGPCSRAPLFALAPAWAQSGRAANHRPVFKFCIVHLLSLILNHLKGRRGRAVPGGYRGCSSLAREPRVGVPALPAAFSPPLGSGILVSAPK